MFLKIDISQSELDSFCYFKNYDQFKNWSKYDPCSKINKFLSVDC